MLLAPQVFGYKPEYFGLSGAYHEKMRRESTAYSVSLLKHEDPIRKSCFTFHHIHCIRTVKHEYGSF